MTGEGAAGGQVRPLLVGVLVVAAIVAGVGGGVLVAGTLSPAGPSPSGIAAASGSPSPSSSNPTPPGPSPTARPTPTPRPTPEPTPVLVPAPLTGLLVSPEAALRHPIAVMVDDHVDARPQSGFNSASVVWQAPAEGGVPRYMMIFQDRIPDGVGPIRSARQYYIEWASEVDAVFAHIGGSPEAMATLRSEGHGQLVYNADGFRFDGTLMWRVTERVKPHNLYTDGTSLRSMAAIVGAADGPVAPIWTFARAAVTERRPVGATITLRYPYETVTYRYDARSNTYARFIDRATTAQVDAADGRQVRPVNVVVLRMRFGPLKDGHPEKHRLEAQDVGTGEAIISTGGRVIHGTWKKAAIDAPTLLFGPDGAPVVLTPGQTFVQVIALSYGYTVVEGAPVPSGIGQR